MDTESGSGDLPSMLVEQLAMATDATGAIVDDLKKLGSSIMDRMEAMLSKYLGKQEESQTSCATTLLSSHDHSIVDLMISPICSSSMECQLDDSTLHALEEYSTGDEEEDFPCESPRATSVVAPKASTTTSLFDAVPDMNPYINGACFMAKATKVSPSTKATSMDDFLANMQGETKRHVESLLAQLGEAQNLIEVKEGLERDAADEIASLSQALQEEQELRVSVEESMDALLESHNLNIADRKSVV